MARDRVYTGRGKKMRTTFEGQIHVNLGRAVLFQGQFWEGALWLPRSQIEIEPDGEDTVVVKVSHWLSKKDNLREFVYYSQEDIDARGLRGE